MHSRSDRAVLNDEQVNAEVMTLLGQLGHHVVRSTKTALRSFDLNPRQFMTLQMLCEEGELGQQDLGNRLHMHKSATVALVDDLTSRGFVERKRSETDRRRQVITPTESAVQVMRQAGPLSAEADAAYLSPLTDLQRLALHDALATLSKHHNQTLK